ncbi:MAG: 23S rRNA (adenine(2503)-C(2))-methyltransferase [Candidatus Omnitrophica bacterium CG1_02_46_14]|nr:MAG: 23S rRNA (adenine(2503)-C(2))-methyltransferase [Candidatus Omnitrophica bacterium CG1_02_46_14]
MTFLVNILDLTPEELKKKFTELDFEPYRADQILQWVYEKGVYDFERMTNLSVDLRKRLKGAFSLAMPEIVESEKSDGNDSKKLLLKLKDGNLVECVYIPMETRHTVCVSSQAGCKFHCAFCASGQNGFFRNLTSGEIISQVLMARDLSASKKITNIVFMGIGEPLDNYTQLMKAIRILNSKNGLGIGARKITISTCGIIPKIKVLSGEGLQIELSVSLHGPNEIVRGSLMPVNSAYSVKYLIEACKQYIKKTKRVITFEYILIKGVNASEKEARDLSRLLKGMLCKVNLIPYNPIEEFAHDAPSYDEIVRFQKALQSKGIKTTVRFSKGQDIQAACGQLRAIHGTIL